MNATGGAAGNARLTGWTGLVLLVLLAAEGVTVPFVRPLLTAHVFIGVLLIPPVALKLGSTGYRFARYYTGHPDYVAAGPPVPVLRVIGPVVVVTSVLLLASGVALIVAGSRHGALLAIHKLSFILWFVVMTIHVLGHVVRAPTLVLADTRGSPVGGLRWRAGLVTASLVTGTVAAAYAASHLGAWYR